MQIWLRIASVRLLDRFEAGLRGRSRGLPDGCLEDRGHASPTLPVVTGAGTGFGIAAFLPARGAFVIPSEGGHANLPGDSRKREERCIGLLRRKFGQCQPNARCRALVWEYRAIADLIAPLFQTEVPPR